MHTKLTNPGWECNAHTEWVSEWVSFQDESTLTRKFYVRLIDYLSYINTYKSNRRYYVVGCESLVGLGPWVKSITLGFSITTRRSCLGFLKTLDEHAGVRETQHWYKELGYGFCNMIRVPGEFLSVRWYKYERMLFCTTCVKLYYSLLMCSSCFFFVLLNFLD